MISAAPQQPAAFELLADGAARVSGALHFTTVSALLGTGSAAITGGSARCIDLGAVADSDSSGLALLIEWMSVARQCGQALRYQNMPAQLVQLARLSDVEELLLPV